MHVVKLSVADLTLILDALCNFRDECAIRALLTGDGLKMQYRLISEDCERLVRLFELAESGTVEVIHRAKNMDLG